MANVLVIHGDASLRLSLLDHLRCTQHRPLEALDIAEARTRHRRERATIAVVLMAARAGDPIATAVRKAKVEWPAAEVILVSRSHNESDAVEAIRYGASDYITVALSSDLGHLLHTVEAASARHRAGQRGGSRTHEHAFTESLDPVTREVFGRADRAALVNSTVLITGESGTGKEVLARRIHRRSSRARFTFVPVNCGSLPESLIETELFGHKKGAFTGANTDSKGLIEAAERGVLFLDEIGDMPVSMQVRLLRFLDGGEVRAVGGTSVGHADVRVIAATNKRLQDEIQGRRFREDLFFRLNVVPLHIPPLRERRVDIPDLVQYHVQEAAARFAVQPPAVSDETLRLLINHNWPGNIRELQNALEHALVQCGGETITPGALPPSIASGTRVGPSIGIRHRGDAYVDLAATLQQHNGHHADTAAALGISRTTLWRRLKRSHDTPEVDAPASGQSLVSAGDCEPEPV